MGNQQISKERINYCAGLVGRSILNDQIKTLILENIDKLSKEEIDGLIESLEREQMELGSLEKKLKEFEKSNDADWKKVENQQLEETHKMTDEFIADEIKQTINKAK